MSPARAYFKNNRARLTTWTRMTYGGRCCYCRRRADTIDHVVPLSRGGSNDVANMRPCCRGCNAAKGNLLVEEWQEKRARTA